MIRDDNKCIICGKLLSNFQTFNLDPNIINPQTGDSYSKIPMCRKCFIEQYEKETEQLGESEYDYTPESASFEFINKKGS